MVYQIVWTPKALESYAGNIRYLEETWTQKEIDQFSQLIEKKLELLSSHPDIGMPGNKKESNVRRTLLHKRVILIYRVKRRNKKIELLTFWNTFQNPAKLRFR